jgi:SAM-dependent methyltransferase
MSNFKLFIDPVSRTRLQYDEIGKCLKTEDRNVVYPIINGIPRFVPRELFEELIAAKTDETQTGRSFGTKWREERMRVLGSTAFDKIYLQEQLVAMLGCSSIEQLKKLFENAQITLNAGCGTAWSEFMFDLNPSTERHCIDLSLSVEVAYANTRHLKNVTVSQASIFDLPYPDGVFDIVYSAGVVHHTPDPKKAVEELAKKVAPGGLLGIYIYNIKPLIREICDSEIRKNTTSMSYDDCMDFSRKMTMLGKSLSQINNDLVIEEDIDLLNIKAGKYKLQRFIYDHFIKCWYNQNQDDEFADIVNQDWYHPRYASHHTQEEVFSWFEECGFNGLTCIQPEGWQHSGFFITGRKGKH